ncbi:hypothetical protein SARC_12731 [Sphaeroforma arctica JP610]|uniref:Uncharacterized protein n=1 Tax=Sphaeroforma arctica JP610 TaxID=667725 RepID=A0A0L0FD85_9EUKA|nr:hypothetical protein SARC_12731 [Sphaeroforma arctica JP610]KNC74729.1 hypothetical protein SARC_12731 [Sphaeroforma arctica JP610]|eukprot:XP_014148631.1 hypothetical protein SARC_12731 [Sphaeroforma arctica JP610]
MATPQNLSSSSKRSFEAFRRVMKSPRQQPAHGQAAANLFRDKLQQHRPPQSPEERKENCQDNANVPIDTLAYRKHFPVHHDRYLEAPQDVKRCNISPSTEACITESTAAEMKTQVFLLTQRMMQAETEGRTEDARLLQGLIRTTNETLKTCSITVDKRTLKERSPNPQVSYYLDSPQKIQLHAFILDLHKNVKFHKLDPIHMQMGLHKALQKEGAPTALLNFIVDNEQKLQSMSFQDATAYIVRTNEQDLEDNAYRNVLACMKLNPSVPLETQLRDFDRKVDFMKMRQYENPLQVYRNHGMLNLINQAAGGAYYCDTLRMHTNWREYSATQMRNVFRVNIDKAEEHRRANLSPGGLRSRTRTRVEANTRANPHTPPASNPRARCRSCEQNLPPGPAHAPRRPKLLRAPTSTNTGSHTRRGYAPPHRTSAGGLSTRTQQTPGNTFRPRVNLVDGGDQMTDPTPAEVGESEVIHIHDLVDESYVDSEDKLIAIKTA